MVGALSLVAIAALSDTPTREEARSLYIGAGHTIFNLRKIPASDCQRVKGESWGERDSLSGFRLGLQYDGLTNSTARLWLAARDFCRKPEAPKNAAPAPTRHLPADTGIAYAIQPMELRVCRAIIASSSVGIT